MGQWQKDIDEAVSGVLDQRTAKQIKAMGTGVAVANTPPIPKLVDLP